MGEVRLVGQGDCGGCPVEIYYIRDDRHKSGSDLTSEICYFCHKCNQEHLLPFDEQDAAQDWFRFTCETCGDEAKRTINLRKVLGRAEV